jgi:hypothetical protein
VQIGMALIVALVLEIVGVWFLNESFDDSLKLWDVFGE